MRTLLLLRGAPGAGKSTWIHENNLEPYTLEADKFRKLLMNPILNVDGDVHNIMIITHGKCFIKH